MILAHHAMTPAVRLIGVVHLYLAQSYVLLVPLIIDSACQLSLQQPFKSNVAFQSMTTYCCCLCRQVWGMVIAGLRSA